MTSSSSSVEKIMKDEFLLIAIVAAIVIVVVLGLVANVILAPSDGSKRASSFDVVCEPQWEECRIGRRLVPFRHRARAASAPGWGTGGGRRSWHAFDCRGYRPAPPPLANATLERWRASYSRCHSPIARLGLSLGPWANAGPLGPQRAMRLGAWWLLREIELFAQDVSRSPEGAAVTALPASRSDAQGLGAVRAHACVCGTRSASPG